MTQDTTASIVHDKEALAGLGYEISEVLGESPQAVVYRVFSRKNPTRALALKVLKTRTLAEGQKRYFHQKIEHLRVLQCPQVVLPLAFEEKGDTRFFIQDFFGGTTLDRWAKSGLVLALERVLAVACRLALVLDDVHKAGIVHGGVKPHNILIHEEPLDVRLIDFITPFDVRDVSHFIYDRSFVLGTLAYTSPEQTGRINHRVDFTTDLYSLGIILYELLTGRLPFQSVDPLELIHSHLAEEAPPVHVVNPSVPPVLGELVAKLTLKQPERRYQCGAGLHWDLRRCYDELKTTGALRSFSLGQQDRSHRVTFVSKMVGRDREVAAILAEHERVARGAFGAVLISGLPGIGKTRLIQELQRPIVKRRGYFTSGKFDLYQKNIPYSSLIQALRNLVRTFLTESDDRLALWRERILTAVGQSGRVITDVVPELTALIGPQPEVMPLPPVESRIRFHDLFNRFLNGLVTEDHPLVMFIDDLQWCDLDSLDFLSNILANRQDHPHLLLLGAYRYNEVDPSHPLSKLIRNAAHDAPLTEIRLGPLDPLHCHEMVSYVLDTPPSRTEALSTFIARLTEGNPLFVSESLSYLHNEDLLSLDEERCWTWDIDRIRRSDMPSTVVALFSSKVRKLPPATIELLEYCACMGNTFSPDDLTWVRESTLVDTFELLKPALGMGLLAESKSQLQFIHDRVQEAILDGIDSQRRQEVHWSIGSRLLSRLPEGTVLGDHDALFAIVSHLNLGTPTDLQTGTAYRLSDVNFQAGNKALGSLATEAANEYFRRSRDLLPPDCWDSQYEKTFRIFQKLAKTELMVGRQENSEALLDDLLEHAKSDLDKAEALAEQTSSLSSIGSFKKAIAAANRGLAFFGKSIPDDPTAAEQARRNLMEKIARVGGDIWDTILDMPFTSDRRSKIELAFYSELIPDLYMSGLVPQLYLSAVQSTDHCLQGGMDESVIYSFSIMGLYLGEQGAFEEAFRYEDLARNLSDRYPNTFGATRGMNGVVWCNMHSRSHPEDVVKYCLRSIRSGKNCGDLYNAGLSYGPLMWNLQVQGTELSAVEEYAKECLQFSQKYRLHFSTGLAEAVIAGWLAPMRGEQTTVPIEERLSQWAQENHIASAGSYHVLRAVSHYLNAEHEEAGRHLQAVTRYLNGLTDNVLRREWEVFRVLNTLALHRRRKPDMTERDLDAFLRPIHERVRTWATLGPTLKPYLALMDAEIARARGEHREARSLFLDAIAGAHAQRFALLEGYLNECLGDMAGEVDLGPNVVWFTEAARWYRRVGAVSMLRRLAERCPGCWTEEAAPVGTAESAPDVSGTLPSMDVEYLMKSSLAMAEETDAEALLDKIMAVVLQASGAQYGCLVSEEGGRLLVSAERSVADKDTPRRARCPLDDASWLCRSIVRYVFRTKERVILDDASSHGAFSDHSEVQALRLRSVLCVPLMKGADVISTLYLENRLADSVFTDARTRVIELLGSQAAVSLRNARVLAERAQVENRLREANDYLDRLISCANAPVLVCDPGRRITKFNGAFERLTGCAAHDVVGRDLGVLFPEPRRREALDEILRTHGGEAVEIPVLHRDGDVRALLWSSTVIVSQDQTTPLAIVAHCQDITERKRLAEQLLQSQKMEGVGQLASGVAHDFNNILGGILGYAELGSRAVAQGRPVGEHLHSIQELAGRGSGIVQQLLAFARKQILAPSPLDLNALIPDFLRLLRQTIGGHIEIVFRAGSELRTVLGDRIQIEQVLMNLCINARDAMPDGGTIVIETEDKAVERAGRPWTQADPYVVIRVADTGMGMDDDTLSRAFHPFFTTKAAGKGTGLGLSVVHGIVAKHGGFIEVHSERGKGTRMEIHLPAHLEGVANESRTKEGTPPRGHGELILLVDDDQAVRDVAKEVLEGQGYVVLTASDGVGGLELFAQHGDRIKLVITDIVMPRLQGWEFCDRIRESSPDTPFLFISGYPLDGVDAQSCGVAMRRCLCKPFSAADLAARVREMLDAN